MTLQEILIYLLLFLFVLFFIMWVYSDLKVSSLQKDIEDLESRLDYKNDALLKIRSLVDNSFEDEEE